MNCTKDRNCSTDVNSEQCVTSEQYTSINAVLEGSGDLEIIARVLGTVILSSSDSVAYVDADEMEWENKDNPAFDDDYDLAGMDVGEAGDLELRQCRSTSKKRRPGRSYKLTWRFQTVWSAL